MDLKVDVRLTVSLAYGLFGLIDLFIFGLSGLRMVHMGVLGLLSVASGIGLFSRRGPFLWLAVALTPLTLTTGIAAIYSSIGFTGLGSNSEVLLLNLGLVGYVAAALTLFFYLIAKRKTFLS